MSLLVALFWWISTARVLVPATSSAGFTGNGEPLRLLGAADGA